MRLPTGIIGEIRETDPNEAKGRLGGVYRDLCHFHTGMEARSVRGWTGAKAFVDAQASTRRFGGGRARAH